MKKVLIISPHTHEQELLQSAALAHRPGDFSFEATTSFAQDVNYWTIQAPDVLVINIPDDDQLQGLYFAKIRKDLLKNQAIIFLCTSISPGLMQISQIFSKVRIMKAPLEKNSLFRAVIDLTAEFEDGRRQISPRYLTEQEIEIRSDLSDGRIRGVMKNLSVTGAYFETLEDGFEIKSGDFVRISVYAGAPVKLYVFDVRIVWTKKTESGNKCFGCTFVNKDEVYNHLLKHM